MMSILFHFMLCVANIVCCIMLYRSSTTEKNVDILFRHSLFILNVLGAMMNCFVVTMKLMGQMD